MTLTRQQRIELERLYASLGRAPTPQEVRELARMPTSSLHDLITWDVHVAADERQIAQSREILASYVFVVEEASETPIEARFFISTPAIRAHNKRLGHESSYTDYDTAGQPNLYDSVLSSAIGAIKGTITRFGAYTEIRAPLEECLVRLEALRRPIEKMRASTRPPLVR